MKNNIEEHSDFMIFPTDYLRIIAGEEGSGSPEEFENLTLKIYNHLRETFPDAYIIGEELYEGSLGVDILYLKGDAEELFEMVQNIMEVFKLSEVRIEADFFQSTKDDIIEGFVNRSLDFGYDMENYMVNIDQTVQNTKISRITPFEDFAKVTDAFGSTFVSVSLKDKLQTSRSLYRYSEKRTLSL